MMILIFIATLVIALLAQLHVKRAYCAAQSNPQPPAIRERKLPRRFSVRRTSPTLISLAAQTGLLIMAAASAPIRAVGWSSPSDACRASRLYPLPLSFWNMSGTTPRPFARLRSWPCPGRTSMRRHATTRWKLRGSKSSPPCASKSSSGNPGRKCGRKEMGIFAPKAFGGREA